MKLTLPVTVLLCSLSTLAHGLWVPPDDSIPAARLIENLERALEAKPDDPHLLARLGRIHSLRYSLGDDTVNVRKDPESDGFRLYEHGNAYPNTRRALESNAIPDGIDDLYTALDYYQRAVDADPDEAYIWLGLGYTCDELSHAAAVMAWPDRAGPDNGGVRGVVRRAWEEKALDAYDKAMGRSPHLDPGGFLTPPVELEAARYIKLILDDRKRLDRREKTLLKTAEKLQGEASRLPRMVTPIIFPLDHARPLDSLLASDVHVSFDLDGTNSGLKWPWVQPNTGLLVWDGNGRRDVPSGRQLIGSVTWWLFWENGYAVLKALDNDQDGWLDVAEMDGLAVWQDRDSDGVAGKGEVQPVSALGIQRISTAIGGEIKGMPFNPRGVAFGDGRVLPTYDWITEPVRTD